MTTSPASTRRTPTWIWVLLILSTLTIFIVMSIVGFVAEYGMAPVDIVVEGERTTIDLGEMDEGEIFGAILALFLVVFVGLVAVPIVVLGVIALALLGVAIGLVVTVLSTLVGLAIVFVPLILVALLVRWAWRQSSRAPAAPEGSPAPPPAPAPATIGR